MTHYTRYLQTRTLTQLRSTRKMYKRGAARADSPAVRRFKQNRAEQITRELYRRQLTA